MSTKLSVVLTTLLYDAESWVIYRRHLRLIERYHHRCLRTILNIHRSNFVTNIEVLEMAKVTSIEAMLIKTQLRWAGHVFRMEDHRLPKTILYEELSTGHRYNVAPRKICKETSKRSLVTCNIDHSQWTTLAPDQMNWRRAVYQTTTSFKTTRRANMEDRKRGRKTGTLLTSTLNSPIHGTAMERLAYLG